MTDGTPSSPDGGETAHRVLVTGATGTLGRQLVSQLRLAGYRVRGLSRRAWSTTETGVEWAIGDLRDGSGLTEAFAGVDTVVHCASDRRGDVGAARLLVEAARAAGSPHVVYISIVGVDRIPLGYYRSKLAVEQVLAGSGLPVTILRATQFYELVWAMSKAQHRLPVLFAFRGVSFQPVDPAEVAGALTELVAAGPSGRVADLGGPEVIAADELARRYLAATGRRRRVVRLPVPGRIGRALRAGANLVPDGRHGRIAFDDYVAQRAENRLVG